MQQFRSLYSKWFPSSVKRVIDPLYGSMPDRIRFGQRYSKTLNLLKQSDRWDESRINDYQIEKLRHLLRHATETVPFYRKVVNEFGIDTNNIRYLEDIKRFPIINKNTIRGHIDDFLSKKYCKNLLVRGTTGGSSGEPLHFYRTYDHSRIEWAFIVNLWGRIGFSTKDWRIVLRGPIVGDASKGVYWHWNFKQKEIILSTYHMTEENMFNYYQIIQRGKFSFLHCHPSSAYIFAKYMKKEKLSYKLKGVLTSSESLYPFQRSLMEDVFQCRVYSLYGQSEQVSLAGECENAEIYHIQPEYGVTEILNSDGQDVNKDNEVGEIIGTGFVNDAMPFIRYRTGDLAVISAHRCSCGRNHRIIKRIEGRNYEYIITKDGRIISLTGLIFGQHFSAFSRIKKMQVHQREKGKIQILIIKGDSFSIADENEIRCQIMNCVRHGLELDFQYPEEIPLTASGKHKFMIQELKIKWFDQRK
jgi:phenylacetate-CoA ligase